MRFLCITQNHGLGIQHYHYRGTIAEGVTLETVIPEGKPAPSIVKFAEKNKIDRTVIGTGGKRDLERLFPGCVPEQVIRTAGRKVLIVK